MTLMCNRLGHTCLSCAHMSRDCASMPPIDKDKSFPDSTTCVPAEGARGATRSVQLLLLSCHIVCRPHGGSMCNVDVSQRMHEERRALFSCFYWAAYAWNRQQLPAAGPLPDQSFWTALSVMSPQLCSVVCCRLAPLCAARSIVAGPLSGGVAAQRRAEADRALLERLSQ